MNILWGADEYDCGGQMNMTVGADEYQGSLQRWSYECLFLLSTTAHLRQHVTLCDIT